MPLGERDTNIPLNARTHTPPSLKTPQLHSRLPRLVVTPNSAPAAKTWASRAADPVASVERTASTLPYTPTYRREPTAIETVQKANKMGLPVRDKPLPQDKALPPRPLARLSTDLSPSKHSRSLIDACEQPLHIASVSGDKREWPTLRPQPSPSASNTPTGELPDSELNSSSSTSSHSVSAANIMAAATELTNTITRKEAGPKRDSKRSPHSPASSYISAMESNSQIAATYRANRDSCENADGHPVRRPRRTLSSASSHMDLPARKASLRSRISSGSLITPIIGSGHQVVTMTDFTRVGAASPASIESRTHSPSPASFSRPRPGSISSTVPTPRSTKTASRIPIPDSKKATMVDVKKDLPIRPAIPRTSGIPTFGSRRLASPDALKILENGKMRRQMQRRPQNESARTSPQIRIVDQESDAKDANLPSSSYSATRASGLEYYGISDVNTALDSSFDDEEEAPTPSDRASHFPGQSRHGSKPPLCVTASEISVDQRLFPGGVMYTTSRPPQTSPFVAPLETIPSEAVLSVDANDFNDETKEELVRTLSHLEGKGSPPKYDVDNETLLHMFGHLKKGLERNPHNSSALVHNAAAAEKFLATRGSSILEVKGLGGEGRTSKEDLVKYPTQELQHTQAQKKQTVISKWSASTPSDKALSPPSDDIGTGHRPPSIPNSRPKTPSLQDPKSIGYPSRIPSRITITNPPTVDDGATIASIPSRRSSPTLSKRKPGSVRAARDGLQISNASFARTTTSAESKKIIRSPNPANRAFSVADAAQRGRMTVAEMPRSKSEARPAEKITRSRSKSRYVLDKINGLFSGKRDKRSVAIPPVPRIEENGSTIALVDSPASISPPPPRPVQVKHLPKMPSVSPPAQAFPRSPSRTTMRTDDTTLVDRISMKDETQCVQVLSEHLVGKARREINPQRKERLLTFAKVLNDSLISVREAAISAETAQHAAKSAQVSYEMTQKSLAMVQRLATVMVRTGNLKAH